MSKISKSKRKINDLEVKPRGMAKQDEAANPACAPQVWYCLVDKNTENYP